MIAEILLILAGHSPDSLFRGHVVQPAFAPLLHPGEKQCLESLGQIAFRYRRIKTSCEKLTSSPSRYIRALCATLDRILKDEYETLVVSTEARVLHRDPDLVASSSFVPLSSIRAIFAMWDAPFAALVALFDELESKATWAPGPLIDMLMGRSKTGVNRIAEIMARLCVAVQRVWRSQLMAFIIHGSISTLDPLVSSDGAYTILPGCMPTCVSTHARESISYVGRAIATVKAAKWQKQPPNTLAAEHTALLESTLPEDQHRFEINILRIRINISEWLWDNILTRKMVEDAVDSLANYFLIRNGEFSLSLIREIERLKLTRLTTRSGSASMIREQDLNTAILRASLGTTAQHDPSLSQLHFSLPSGPLRPLLPSLATGRNHSLSNSMEVTVFDDLLLGTRVNLTFTVTWPLDLFLHPPDLQIYSTLFGYLSSLRKTHTCIHTCWTSLSNAQRARRRWTGLSEGGTEEDLEARKNLLRCGWGIVRDMGWFLDTVLGYVLTDVVDVEYRQFKALLEKRSAPQGGTGMALSASAPDLKATVSSISMAGRARTESIGGGPSTSTAGAIIDFSTLRELHTTFLERVFTGCLLSYPALTAILRAIFEICEGFVAQVERWGGDVLPALLFEGSIRGDDRVGAMVQERWEIVAEINETLHTLLQSFYEQLSLSTSQQPFTDTSKSMMMNVSMAANNTTRFQQTTTFIRKKGVEGVLGTADVRRHVERLLLRLDFNGRLSQRTKTGSRRRGESDEILKELG